MSMSTNHILIIADGRSPTTIRWISMLRKMDLRVTLVSTYPILQESDAEQTFICPVAFSQVGRQNSVETGRPVHQINSLVHRIIQSFRPIFLRFRYYFAPMTLAKQGLILQRIIAEINPDVVHALRIPYEGMLAMYTPPEIPQIISVWGNDFTLHARATKKMANLTKQVMQRADGLMADTHRDIKLAHQMGFDRTKPALVVPGGGGINLTEIEKAKNDGLFPIENNLHAPVIINPRGIRSYTQTDVFFKSLPAVLEKFPHAKIFCAAMKSSAEAEKWLTNLNLQNKITLLPQLPQKTLWSLFSQSDISISMTTHDGTPNTLLEAMACGSFPIAGDIESLREWITPGVNGLLVETGNPEALSQAIIFSLQHPQLFKTAAIENFNRIKEHAEIGAVQKSVYEFYQNI